MSNLRTLSLAAAAAVAFAGCGDDSSGDPDSGDPAADAAPGDGPVEVGCDPLDPRTEAPELFVGPTGLQARLLGLIDGADSELWISMYLFTVDALADAVIDAHQRGVDVRVILDPAHQRGVDVRVILDPDHEGNPDVRGDLDAAGVPVRDAAGVPVRDASADFDFFHVKAMLVDGDTAVIMSSNFNFGAMNDERNYGVIDRDPDDVADLRAIMDSDWEARGFPDLSCTRLLVSPVNARTRMLEHINGATETLDVEAIYITDSSLRTAIIDAHQRGVAVRILLAHPDDWEENADTATLFGNAGIEVRGLRSPFVHAKLLIADGVAWVGSQNLSYGSLTQNREVGVLVHEPTPAAAAQLQYDTDWENGAGL